MKRWIPFLKSGPVVSVVRLQGTIAANGARGLSDRGLAEAIEKAFSRGKPAAVALEINSPGGSPVQSALIAARIMRLSRENEIPVYSFVEDVAASGGYWLATAGQEIHVDRGSLVGSIGVIAASFGLPQALDKVGVERRVHTAGKSKSFMDPFQPEKPEDIKRLRGMLDELHAYFKDHVTERRAGKLAEGQDLFTGDVWVGRQSVEVGLADGLGQLVPVMQDRFGDKVRFRRYGQKRGLFQRVGAGLAADAIAGLEDRAAYARFGL